jgi:hypothetical protein
MTSNTLLARDVAFPTSLAEFLLASGSDCAADAILSAISPEREDKGRAVAPEGGWDEVFVR